MRDAEKWAMEERANIDIYPERLADIIRQAQLEGIRYALDGIENARDGYLPAVKFQADGRRVRQVQR